MTKRNFAWLPMGALLMLMLTGISCNREEQRGTVRFQLEMNGSSALKGTRDSDQLSAALVTIRDINGMLIYDKEHLPLYSFGDSYATRSLELPAGGFTLEEFMLIDASGVVRWATPREGSELALLVRQPLPVPFEVIPDQTTSLDIQVVRTEDHPPSDFGYVSFDIGFVDTFCLQVFFSSRCMDSLSAGNDSLIYPMAPEIPYYLPMLKIRSGSRVLLKEPLYPGINQYRIPVTREPYELIASDCRGKVVYEEVLPLENLLEHRCGDRFEPLIIQGDPDPPILITPEGLTEPGIDQGIFGQVTIGLDGFMLDSADYPPVVRDIYLYPYEVWHNAMDSLWTFAPLDCYIPGEFLWMEPLAIVRSNSAGYFQVWMEPGDYLYVVREGDRYYVSSYLDSQLPGYVKVVEGQVTWLPVHIIDCSVWM